MKKIVFFFCLFLTFNSFAQKSYINILASDILEKDCSTLYITGDLPQGIKSYYSKSENMSVGAMLNILSSMGYEVEMMSAPSRSTVATSSSSHSMAMCYLLSSPVSSNTPGSIPTISSDDGEEVHEVARYNLQGLPVTPNTKGIQIIVYSNYTTETVIVE